MSAGRGLAPGAWRKVAVAVAAVLVVGGIGAVLGLSYLGVVSRDVRVEAHLPDLGDTLGRGAKVRYHGIIVGYVVDLDRRSDGYSVELLVNSEHAESIPASATVRVLPSTLFGSEFVELLGEGAASPDLALASGDVLEADSTEGSLRLMESFDTAERLIKSVDVEQLTAATSRLAEALDGHGEDVGEFIERADAYVTTLDDDSELFFGTLSASASALDTLADIEPDLVSAAEHARTTAGTVVAKRQEIRRLMVSGTDLADSGTDVLDDHGDTLVDLVLTSAVPMDTFAAHDADLRLILARVPNVLHNGATSIDEASIQMEGMVGVDPYDPYTSADCPRYGTFAGSNCGGGQ
jgi:phospholipid/cholesterol/gamma-HCH transport system substrate-binding protein